MNDSNEWYTKNSQISGLSGSEPTISQSCDSSISLFCSGRGVVVVVGVGGGGNVGMTKDTPMEFSKT